jgi:hypothetical protein
LKIQAATALIALPESVLVYHSAAVFYKISPLYDGINCISYERIGFSQDIIEFPLAGEARSL